MNILKIGSDRYYNINETGFISSVTSAEVSRMINPNIHIISSVDHHLEKMERRKFKKKSYQISVPSVAITGANFYYHDPEKNGKLLTNSDELTELPPILVTPQFLFTKGKGSPIQISAIFSTKNTPTIDWYRNDAKIVENDHYKLRCEEDDYKKYIVSMTIINDVNLEEEEPIFKCSVTDAIGVNEISFKINFDKKYGTPTFTEMPQFFVKESKNGIKSVIIKVFYYSEFQPYIVWSKDGKEIFYNNNDTHIANNKKLHDIYNYECDFEISNFDEKDIGTYYFYFITRYGYDVFTIKLNDKSLDSLSKYSH